MQYRRLGKTGLMVSEIGFGGEWLERHEESESGALMKYAHSKGINIVDCWMPDPKSRDIIGQAIAKTGPGGTSRGTSAPPTRTASTPAPGMWNSAGLPLKTCWPG